MATFSNGGTVWAGFQGEGGSSCVASATVSWDSNLVVTVSNVKYSYASGTPISSTCKWRVRPLSGGNPLAGTDYTPSFSATEGVQYVFQACVSGPYPWGNSTKAECEDGSSYFTVTQAYIPPPDIPETYTITYDANGGSGASPSHFKTEGEITYLSYAEPTKEDVYEAPYVVTLNANGGSCSVKSLSSNRIKYFTFGYWNTKPDGSGTIYHPGGSYTYDADLTLYAIYLEDMITQSVELPTPTKNGYEFIGWAVSSDLNSGIFGEYFPDGDITLYAIWKANGLIYIYDGNEFCAYQVFIYDGFEWNLYCPYIYDSGWSLCS